MILDTPTAKKLHPLLNREVEEAFLLLLECVSTQLDVELDDMEASDNKIRSILGKRQLVKDLKQYRQRIIDAASISRA